ncbi:hypothetical protein MMC28_004112 [Mycoblastus sanguinarius]|nr:hypothetical protein [Mycoblastus sanguinarius]
MADDQPASLYLENAFVSGALQLPSDSGISHAIITFLLLATFPGWQEEIDEGGGERDVKPFPSRPVSQGALAASALAPLLALVSMVWQHTASVAAATAAQKMGYGSVKSEIGTLAMALGWVGMALLAVAAIVLAVIVLSISLIASLTDD